MLSFVKLKVYEFFYQKSPFKLHNFKIFLLKCSKLEKNTTENF